MKLSSTKPFKTVGVDLDTYVIKRPKRVTPKNAPGLKKGTGGLADGGMGESMYNIIGQLIVEEIRDITDTDEAETSEDLELVNPEDDEGDEGGDEGLKRYVKGAHLVYKRSDEVDSFEELWIYPIDPKNPQEHAKIEAQIIAGTDINISTMASEDGTQTAVSWVAGNAKMLKISGLSN